MSAFDFPEQHAQVFVGGSLRGVRNYFQSYVAFFPKMSAWKTTPNLIKAIIIYLAQLRQLRNSSHILNWILILQSGRVARCWSECFTHQDDPPKTLISTSNHPKLENCPWMRNGYWKYPSISSAVCQWIFKLITGLYFILTFQWFSNYNLKICIFLFICYALKHKF